MFRVTNPAIYLGRVVGNGHCVRLCQVAAPDLPPTSQWRRGRRVRGGNVPPGTIVATFSPDGRYTNSTDGDSHAAVLIEETESGLRVIDQWIGQPVHQRTIPFRNGSGAAANDGDRFHVVEADKPGPEAARNA
jgi:hypothetical protein